jgi:hypothetical protein
MKYQAETQGISRNRSAVVVATLFVSEIEPSPANIMAALRGDGFYIRPRPGCDRKGNPNSIEWRDKDVWHLYAADMMRTIRAINEHPFSADGLMQCPSSGARHSPARASVNISNGPRVWRAAPGS